MAQAIIRMIDHAFGCIRIICANKRRGMLNKKPMVETTKEYMAIYFGRKAVA
jgi:hypothetical protein